MIEEGAAETASSLVELLNQSLKHMTFIKRDGKGGAIPRSESGRGSTCFTVNRAF